MSVTEQTHEQSYMLDRGGLFSEAVGVARLRLMRGDPEGALKALDKVCAETHILHFDACVADGHSVEMVERFLGPRDGADLDTVGHK